MTTLAAHDWVTRDPATAEYAWGAGDLTGLADTRPYRAELQALAAATGTQVYLARREDTSLVIVETAGEMLTGATDRPGHAHATGRAVRARLRRVVERSERRRRGWRPSGQPSTTLRRRMSAVLKEIRTAASSSNA